MLTNAIRLEAGFPPLSLMCHSGKISQTVRGKTSEWTWLLKSHSSPLLFVVFSAFPPLLFVPSAWTDLGWVGWACLLMKATEDRWCRLFVVGRGPELQRDPWQEKSRLSVIISANQVEYYPCFSIKTSPQSPDIAVWISSSPASIKKVLHLHLSFGQEALSGRSNNIESGPTNTRSKSVGPCCMSSGERGGGGQWCEWAEPLTHLLT